MHGRSASPTPSAPHSPGSLRPPSRGRRCASSAWRPPPPCPLPMPGFCPRPLAWPCGRPAHCSHHSPSPSAAPLPPSAVLPRPAHGPKPCAPAMGKRNGPLIRRGSFRAKTKPSTHGLTSPAIAADPISPCSRLHLPARLARLAPLGKPPVAGDGVGGDPFAPSAGGGRESERE